MAPPAHDPDTLADTRAVALAYRQVRLAQDTPTQGAHVAAYEAAMRVYAERHPELAGDGDRLEVSRRVNVLLAIARELAGRWIYGCPPSAPDGMARAPAVDWLTPAAPTPPGDSSGT